MFSFLPISSLSESLPTSLGGSSNEARRTPLVDNRWVNESTYGGNYRNQPNCFMQVWQKIVSFILITSGWIADFSYNSYSRCKGYVYSTRVYENLQENVLQPVHNHVITPVNKRVIEPVKTNAIDPITNRIKGWIASNDFARNLFPSNYFEKVNFQDHESGTSPSSKKTSKDSTLRASNLEANTSNNFLRGSNSNNSSNTEDAAEAGEGGGLHDGLLDLDHVSLLDSHQYDTDFDDDGESSTTNPKTNLKHPPNGGNNISDFRDYRPSKDRETIDKRKAKLLEIENKRNRKNNANNKHVKFEESVEMMDRKQVDEREAERRDNLDSRQRDLDSRQSSKSSIGSQVSSKSSLSHVKDGLMKDRKEGLMKDRLSADGLSPSLLQESSVLSESLSSSSSSSSVLTSSVHSARLRDLEESPSFITSARIDEQLSTNSKDVIINIDDLVHHVKRNRIQKPSPEKKPSPTMSPTKNHRGEIFYERDEVIHERDEAIQIEKQNIFPAQVTKDIDLEEERLQNEREKERLQQNERDKERLQQQKSDALSLELDEDDIIASTSVALRYIEKYDDVEPAGEPGSSFVETLGTTNEAGFTESQQPFLQADRSFLQQAEPPPEGVDQRYVEMQRPFLGNHQSEGSVESEEMAGDDVVIEIASHSRTQSRASNVSDTIGSNVSDPIASNVSDPIIGDRDSIQGARLKEPSEEDNIVYHGDSDLDFNANQICDQVAGIDIVENNGDGNLDNMMSPQDRIHGNHSPNHISSGISSGLNDSAANPQLRSLRSNSSRSREKLSPNHPVAWSITDSLCLSNSEDEGDLSSGTYIQKTVEKEKESNQLDKNRSSDDILNMINNQIAAEDDDIDRLGNMNRLERGDHERQHPLTAPSRTVPVYEHLESPGDYEESVSESHIISSCQSKITEDSSLELNSAEKRLEENLEIFEEEIDDTFLRSKPPIIVSEQSALMESDQQNPVSSSQLSNPSISQDARSGVFSWEAPFVSMEEMRKAPIEAVNDSEVIHDEKFSENDVHRMTSEENALQHPESFEQESQLLDQEQPQERDESPRGPNDVVGVIPLVDGHLERTETNSSTATLMNPLNEVRTPSAETDSAPTATPIKNDVELITPLECHRRNGGKEEDHLENGERRGKDLSFASQKIIGSNRILNISPLPSGEDSSGSQKHCLTQKSHSRKSPSRATRAFSGGREGSHEKLLDSSEDILNNSIFKEFIENLDSDKKLTPVSSSRTIDINRMGDLEDETPPLTDLNDLNTDPNDSEYGSKTPSSTPLPATVVCNLSMDSSCTAQGDRNQMRVISRTAIAKILSLKARDNTNALHLLFCHLASLQSIENDYMLQLVEGIFDEEFLTHENLTLWSNIDVDGFTPLHYIMYFENKDVVLQIVNIIKQKLKVITNSRQLYDTFAKSLYDACNHRDKVNHGTLLHHLMNQGHKLENWEVGAGPTPEDESKTKQFRPSPTAEIAGILIKDFGADVFKVDKLQRNAFEFVLNYGASCIQEEFLERPTVVSKVVDAMLGSFRQVLKSKKAGAAENRKMIEYIEKMLTQAFFRDYSSESFGILVEKVGYFCMNYRASSKDEFLSKNDGLDNDVERLLQQTFKTKMEKFCQKYYERYYKLELTGIVPKSRGSSILSAKKLEKQQQKHDEEFSKGLNASSLRLSAYTPSPKLKFDFASNLGSNRSNGSLGSSESRNSLNSVGSVNSGGPDRQDRHTEKKKFIKFPSIPEHSPFDDMRPSPIDTKHGVNFDGNRKETKRMEYKTLVLHRMRRKMKRIVQLESAMFRGVDSAFTSFKLFDLLCEKEDWQMLEWFLEGRKVLSKEHENSIPFDNLTDKNVKNMADIITAEKQVRNMLKSDDFWEEFIADSSDSEGGGKGDSCPPKTILFFQSLFTYLKPQLSKSAMSLGEIILNLTKDVMKDAQNFDRKSRFLPVILDIIRNYEQFNYVDFDSHLGKLDSNSGFDTPSDMVTRDKAFATPLDDSTKPPLFALVCAYSYTNSTSSPFLQSQMSNSVMSNGMMSNITTETYSLGKTFLHHIVTMSDNSTNRNSKKTIELKKIQSLLDQLIYVIKTHDVERQNRCDRSGEEPEGLLYQLLCLTPDGQQMDGQTIDSGGQNKTVIQYAVDVGFPGEDSDTVVILDLFLSKIPNEEYLKVDSTKNCRSALSYACKNGNLPACKFILNHPICSNMIFCTDQHGKTALHIASNVTKGKVQIVEAILAKTIGGDFGEEFDEDKKQFPLQKVESFLLQKDVYGRHFLHYLSYKTNTHIMKSVWRFLESKNGSAIDLKQALLRAQDNQGFTPLHWASKVGDKEACEFMLSNNVDLNPSSFSINKADLLSIRSNQNRTPFEVAYRNERKEIVELLKRWDFGNGSACNLKPPSKKKKCSKDTNQTEEDGFSSSNPLSKDTNVNIAQQTDRNLHEQTNDDINHGRSSADSDSANNDNDGHSTKSSKPGSTSSYRPWRKSDSGLTANSKNVSSTQCDIVKNNRFVNPRQASNIVSHIAKEFERRYSPNKSDNQRSPRGTKSPRSTRPSGQVESTLPMENIPILSVSPLKMPFLGRNPGFNPTVGSPSKLPSFENGIKRGIGILGNFLSPSKNVLPVHPAISTLTPSECDTVLSPEKRTEKIGEPGATSENIEGTSLQKSRADCHHRIKNLTNTEDDIFGTFMNRGKGESTPFLN